MFPQLPPPITNSRRQKCGDCNCGLDFGDPCASCPMKRWGPEMCEFPPEEETQQVRQQEPQPRSAFPTVRQMAANLASAVKSEVKSQISGQVPINPEEIASRLAICEGCEFFHAPSKRCKKCGCFLKWKTAWRSQSCPIGKW
jgi:hypothetical protein